jgi:hypothetical protein
VVNQRITEDDWKVFEIRLKYFQGVGKQQGFYADALTILLCVVWASQLLGGGTDISLEILGISVKVSSFWPAMPFLITVLVLAWIGSVHQYLHAWRRLDAQVSQMQLYDKVEFIAELESHRTFLDYFGALTLSLTRPILPERARPDEVRWRDRIGALLYPLMALLSLFTTSYSIRPLGDTDAHMLYVGAAVFLQVVFSWPLLWRKSFQFAGVYNNEYQAMRWDGGSGLNRSPYKPLSRAQKLVGTIGLMSVLALVVGTGTGVLAKVPQFIRSLWNLTFT